MITHRENAKKFLAWSEAALQEEGKGDLLKRLRFDAEELRALVEQVLGGNPAAAHMQYRYVIGPLVLGQLTFYVPAWNEREEHLLLATYPAAEPVHAILATEAMVASDLVAAIMEHFGYDCAWFGMDNRSFRTQQTKVTDLSYHFMPHSVGDLILAKAGIQR